MQLTNAREAAGFFLGRAIVVAAMFVVTPQLLSPLYAQLVRSGGAAFVGLIALGVNVVSWLVTLVLFLALRGGFGGVPASVAPPDRRSAVTSSGEEIGAYVIALVLAVVIVSVLNIAVVSSMYVSLRQSGQTYLIVPLSLTLAAITAIVFFLLFAALRFGMTGGASATGEIGERMGFGEAIATCFRKYAVFNGRASRSEYWFWMLFQLLLGIGLAIVDLLVFRTTNVLSAIASLVMFLPGLAVWVRRLHDIDRSGWWVLIWLVPVVGTIIMLVFLCTRGTAGENRFGIGPASTAIPEVFA
jgi:uncharacterized membrane protein YhaH (DUF805 family)